jgi:hypothetical protein
MSHQASQKGQELKRNAIEQAVSILQATSGLDFEQAKLAVYYAISTWKLPELGMFPILRLCGPPGTGKTSGMQQLASLCYQPRRISGKRITAAALRDELAEAPNGTALIEEADETADPKGCEQLLAARYSRSTSKLEVKRAGKTSGWVDCSLNIFGATVVHYRTAFIDQATASRCITITTRYRDGNYKAPMPYDELVPRLKGLAGVTDLSEVADLGKGRVHDVWAPVLAIAVLCKDKSWLDWAGGQMEKETEDLRDGHAYDIDGLILARIVECLSDKQGHGIVCHKLNVQHDIITPLWHEQVIRLSPWQASRQLKELGFHVERVGGQNRFTPTLESLRAAAEKIGYQDHLLDRQR